MVNNIMVEEIVRQEKKQPEEEKELMAFLFFSASVRRRITSTRVRARGLFFGGGVVAKAYSGRTR